MPQPDLQPNRRDPEFFIEPSPFDHLQLELTHPEDKTPDKSVSPFRRCQIDLTYFLPDLISTEGLRSLTVPNAGGRSEISEMYSIDYFNRFYGSDQTICETEVSYWVRYKMVDFITTIREIRVGVSVARAMGYPDVQAFTEKSARKLLKKKIFGLIIARNAVNEEHSFFTCIVHLWCQTVKIAELIRLAYYRLLAEDTEIGESLHLYLTVCSDPRIYKNGEQVLSS